MRTQVVIADEDLAAGFRLALPLSPMDGTAPLLLGQGLRCGCSAQSAAAAVPPQRCRCAMPAVVRTASCTPSLPPRPLFARRSPFSSRSHPRLRMHSVTTSPMLRCAVHVLCCSGAATPACISTEHLSRLSLTAKWLDSRDGNGSRACSHYNLSLVSGPGDGWADRHR